MKYFDFDIRISAESEGRYRVRASSAKHGESKAVIHFNPSTQEIVDFIRHLEARETDRAFLEALGLGFYKSLFVDQIDTNFQRSYGET